MLIVGLALLEYTFMLPNDFNNRKDYSHQHNLSEMVDRIETIIEDHKLGKHNVRFADFETEHFGFFLGNGYSTFRNGAVCNVHQSTTILSKQSFRCRLEWVLSYPRHS